MKNNSDVLMKMFLLLLIVTKLSSCFSPACVLDVTVETVLLLLRKAHGLTCRERKTAEP